MTLVDTGLVFVDELSKRISSKWSKAGQSLDRRDLNQQWQLIMIN